MDISKFHTKLRGRVLCGDGDSIVELPFLYEYLLNGGKASDVFLSKKDYKSAEVSNYNKKFIHDKISYKTSINELSTDWDIPKKYRELDVEKYVWDRLQKEGSEKNLTNEEYKQRILRTTMELRVWNKRNLLGLLCTLVYIVNTFEENKVVWGTGRGSSCASYVLYLIGVHQVDSVKYDLDLGEFFR